MKPRHIARFLGLGVAVVTTWAVSAAVIPSAPAQPCPDVEVVFARGTGEAPGVGPTGQAFVDSLQSKVGTNSLGVYPVDYPATNDWPTGLDGIRDASAHVESMAATCSKTQMVLGGFSQGAAVMGFVTADAIPDGVDGDGVPAPMPPEVADHVAAVVLFGMPNARAMNFLGEPPVIIGPRYAGKTIQLCAPEDAVCSEGLDFAAHNAYAEDGMVDKGAAFAASRLGPSAAQNVAPPAPHWPAPGEPAPGAPPPPPSEPEQPPTAP